MSLYWDLKPVKKTVENYDWKGGGLNLNVGIQNLMNKFWPTYMCYDNLNKIGLELFTLTLGLHNDYDIHI